MKHWLVRTFVVLAPLLAAATPSAALDPLPEKAGWHGFDVMGAGIQKLQSNFIGGSWLQEFGEEEIDSPVDQPDSGSDLVPFIKGEIGNLRRPTRTALAFPSSPCFLPGFRANGVPVSPAPSTRRAPTSTSSTRASCR